MGDRDSWTTALFKMVSAIPLLFLTISSTAPWVSLATGGESGEPVCLSRFDHDYKVLQKLVDLEQKQKELEQKFEQKTEKCADHRCGDGWMQYKGSCYLFVNGVKMSWSQGDQYCGGVPGAHLVAIETLSEQQFLTTQVKRMASSDSHPIYWVGATDSEQEGTWTWYPSGVRVDEGGAKWHPGQPQQEEDCGCLIGAFNFSLHDCHCHIPGYIACEKNLAPI